MVYKLALDQLLPQHCLCCGASTRLQPLCEGCRLDLPWTGIICPRCGLPTSDGNCCGRCLSHPPAFDRCIAPLQYRFPLPSLIGRFKHQRRPAYGAALAQLLVTHLQQTLPGVEMPELIVPVPLHWWRRLRRGFNQAELIARDCGQALGIAVDTRLLRRVRATPPQQSLGRLDREHNLRNVFDIAPRRRHDQPPRHVALVDDVVTTMSTCDALARLLKQHGIGRVDVWALARTPRS
jgi:ComF family protein